MPRFIAISRGIRDGAQSALKTGKVRRHFCLDKGKRARSVFSDSRELMATHPYPLTFVPVYKDYVWGGDRIARLYQRSATGVVCAESWEIADRPEGMSIVAAGASRGRSLHELVKEMGPGLLGAGATGRRFPLLVKIIDARERLSVQVHPGDKTAHLTGGEPKTEAWYALPGSEGGCVYAGMRRGVGRAGLLRALRQGNVDEILRCFPLTPGRAVFVPGGRLHAIGEGSLLLEVQQNSDTTYRVHDWGRGGRGRRPRPLHIEQALRVINWKDRLPTELTPRRRAVFDRCALDEILTCPFFRLERLALHGASEFQNSGQSFHILFVASGKVGVEAGSSARVYGPGTSILMPAGLARYRLVVERPVEVIRISVPPAAL
jgi:mannose-6-phosphate isomerase